jgi:uncharacterized membrane protein YeaQ/YmgE (transglycosylase-associated protein family)
MGIMIFVIIGFSLAAGFAAQRLVPGPDPAGIVGTILIGVAGGLVGGLVGSLVAGVSVTSITASPNNGLCVFGPGTPGGNNSPACVPGGVDLTGASSPGYATIDFFPSGANLGNIEVNFTNQST